MCTLETAALVSQGLGVGTSTYGAYTQANLQRQGLQYQAQVARNNAQLAEWQAQDALDRGRRNVQQVQRQTAQVKSSQRATLAARGVDLGVGSALDALTGTDYMGEIDAGTAEQNAAMEAWALRQQAAGFRSDAQMLLGQSRVISPGIAAAPTLLSGATQVATNWYTLKRLREGGDQASAPDVP